VAERLFIAKYVQRGQAISSDEAEEIHLTIRKRLEEERKVVLDFSGIFLLFSSFLNSAIGRLYGEFKPDFIERSVAYENIDSGDECILKMVLDRARDYQMHKDIIDGIIDDP
jgi:hypothetical protein